MARINSIGIGNSSTASRNPNHSTDTLPVLNGNEASVAERYDIKQSEVYQIAWNTFHNLADQSWMNRLEAIANSDKASSGTILDDYGLSTNREDQYRENYNHQVTEIQNLLAEYQKFVHELPITQVQQFADAGYNSSITGQGLSSSAVDPQLQQTSPTSTPSSNPLEGISTLGNIATSLSGGIASIAQTVSGIFKNVNDVRQGWSNVQISEASTAYNIWKSLFDEGINVPHQPFRDLSEFDSFSKASDLDNGFMKKYIDTRNAYFESFQKGAKYEGFVNPNEYQSHLLGDDFADFYRSIADYEAQTMAAKSYADYLRQGIDTYVAENLDPEMASVAANYKVEAEAAIDGLSSLISNIKASYISDWVDLFNKTHDPVSKYSILKTLFSLDLDDQMHMELIKKLGSATAVNATIGAVKTGADLLSSFVGKSKHLQNHTHHSTVNQSIEKAVTINNPSNVY